MHVLDGSTAPPTSGLASTKSPEVYQRGVRGIEQLNNPAEREGSVRSGEDSNSREEPLLFTSLAVALARFASPVTPEGRKSAQAIFYLEVFDQSKPRYHPSPRRQPLSTSQRLLMAETPEKGTSAPAAFCRELRFSSTFPKLTEEQLQNFRVSKICHRNKDKLISLDFSNDGEHVVACCADNTLLIYNCQQGMATGELSLSQYGGDIIRWGHDSDTVIHSSKIFDYNICYLALQEAKYITLLKGHQQKVLSLSLSSQNYLISGSLDQSIRLWDLRFSDCINIKSFQGETVCTFHPEGTLIATGIGSKKVVFHDIRFASRPLNTFWIGRYGNWGGLKFSNDGKLLLISTNSSCSYLTDPEQQTVFHTFEGYDNTNAFPLEASFTPDSEFIIIGSEDGKVHIWNAESGRKVVVLNEEKVDSITCLQFNPKLMSFVSANTNMAFWEPRIDN
ncbi:WD repeat-containing protein 82-like [Trichosurus vulpecula]|uniref:WD repeat-containing protein 82-like n=1 Tax=Trichosurus vulpecula TaxID=9337 RepID=UPI00186AC4CF|nr:WD repeat-containing protein 82-like [Trichosurus vulpecula]